MRVLIVVCDFGRGGVQRGARNFARGLSDLGHEVALLTTTADLAQHPEPDGAIPVVNVGRDDVRLPQAILEFRPELVQVHAHLLRWEVVTWLRSAFPSAVFVEQSVWSRWMPSTSHVDVICHQSPWMASVFSARTRFRRRRPIGHMLGKPVGVRAFSDDFADAGVDFRAEWGIPADAVVLGRVGQPYGDKWHACLVTSFRELAPKYPNLFLLVVAPPDNIKRAIGDLPDGLRQRTLTVDWLEGDDALASAYSAVDIFGHAARRGESFGFVLIESLASATPIVTLSTPYQDNAQIDWVGESGAGIVAESPSAFTDAIEQLVNDEAARSARGRLGPPYVDRFRTESVCTDLMDQVERLQRVQHRSRYRRSRTDTPWSQKPWVSLHQAGIAVPRSVRLAVTVRPLLSWFHKGDRLWSESLRWWLERRVWPRERRVPGPVSAATPTGPGIGRNLGVIIPTYHRDRPLESTLTKLAAQTVPPKEVLVVDNANSASCRQLCSALAPSLPYEVTYLPSPMNGGPAGASSLGINHFLAAGTGIDWIVRGDDDSPSVRHDLFERLLEAADQVKCRTPSLGGIGCSGAVYNRRTGQLSKPPAHPSGLVSVDYLATNFFPLYSIDAVGVVGGFRDDLFFGHDEVEFGLRLRAAGFNLYRVDSPGQTRRDKRPSRRLAPPSWRRYYSLRNQIVIARDHAGPLAAPRLTLISLVKPIVNVVRSPRLGLENLSLAVRANADAYRGRLGRTVEPSVIAGVLGYRWAVAPDGTETQGARGVQRDAPTKGR